MTTLGSFGPPGISRLPNCWMVALATSALFGCGEVDQGAEAADQNDVMNTEGLAAALCPSCEPTAGGETSDFGGTPSPCTAFFEKNEISDEDATAHGVDMVSVRRQMERAIDAPLYWKALPVQEGSPTMSGFVDGDRLTASVEVRSQTWSDVASSALCDGATCRASDSDLEIEQSSCPPFLELEFELNFLTSKSELQATAPGRGFLWVGLGETEVVRGNAFVDVADLPGNLAVSWPASEGVRSGMLVVFLEFSPEKSSGDLRFDFFRRDDVTLAQFIPLQGYWPALPTNSSPGGAAPDSAGRVEDAEPN